MQFLTQLNSGCIEICKNMLKSAERIGLDVNNFMIACLDKNAFDALKEYSGAFLFDNNTFTDYQDWSFDPNSNFRQIVRKKWKLIKEVHQTNNNLCWVDTDIVFVQNPLQYIENSSKVLFQCDLPGSLICSGFMVFNGSDVSKQIVEVCGSNTEEDDQILINNMVRSNSIFQQECALLNQDLFPNGYVYHTLKRKQSAVIVHNNHMVGINTKINKFKEENLWFI